MSTATEFLASRIDYERTATVPYNQRELRLERMRELLERLGNPQSKLSIVHVAGTKGKGSTAAMIASALQAARYRTGLYSSPHLDRPEERLAIDGQACPADAFAELVARVQPVVAAMDAQPSIDDSSNRPTYFEILTALALLRFADCGTDAAVLEVGLGGRLDSTNVCDPLVSVITSISFDHTQQLGNTLAAIAAEKAGIIKPGRPAVSGVVDAEPRDIIAAIARERGCRLVQLGCDFDFDYRPARDVQASDALAEMEYIDHSARRRHDQVAFQLRLLGRHQAANAAVALATLAELRQLGWHIPLEAERAGLAKVRWPARIEVIGRRPTVVLDTSHNVASIEALLEVLDESFAARRRILLLAISRDKDLRGMLQRLAPKFDELILTRFHSNPRSAEPLELDRLAAEFSSGPRTITADPATAWSLAIGRSTAQDLLCITGSFFVAAEVRTAMGNPSQSDGA